MTIIDLHLHSTHSDGQLSVRELVEKLQQHGVRIASLTDHDGTDGAKEFSARAGRAGIVSIPGVEISVSYKNFGLHLLGYGLRLADPRLRKLFRQQIKERRKSFLTSVQCFKKAGFFINQVRLRELLKLKTLAKPHIFSLISANPLNHPLLKKLFSLKTGLPSQGEFIERFMFRPGQVAYIRKSKISYQKVLRLIHRTGGLAVWAHPAVEEEVKDPKRFTEVLEKLVSSGLDGLEVYSSAHSKPQMKRLAAIAKKYQLLSTIGSDDHDGSRLGQLKVSEDLQKEIIKNLTWRLNQLKTA